MSRREALEAALWSLPLGVVGALLGLGWIA